MSKKNIITDNDRDAGVVEEICGYLTEVPPRNYFLFAGAGSGKTRTLVEVLRRMTGVVAHEKGDLLARSLHTYGRSIRVITYTKNAVSVINGRLGDNDLVNVSTIHAFCWELISGFNDDIRAALIAIKEAQLEKEIEEARAKPRGITPAKQRDLDKIRKDIEGFRNTDLFIYHPDRMTYGPGALAHNHVLDVTAWLLKNRPTLARILKDRHPIVLIDESQDTMKGMLDALIAIAESRGCGLTIGLIGDHRQRIYMDGHDDLPSLVPDSWAKPELKMNHRSQRRIVDLINTIWEAKLKGRTQPANGIRQHSRTEKADGFVRIYIGDTRLSPEDKALSELWCADRMWSASGVEAWSKRDFQLLALEHKLVATRGAFLDVFSAMVLLDPNAAAPSGSGENKGPAVVQTLLNELTDLEGCINSDGTIDEFKVTEVFRRYDCLERIPEDTAARAMRVEEILAAIETFAIACANPLATVGDVLEPILSAKLFNFDNRLAAEYVDKSPPPSAPARGEEESIQDRLRRGLCALFSAPWNQLKKYRSYLSGNSILATHQVVKGSEFPHVMVVMDDKLAGGTLFCYDKVFGGVELSKKDNENREKGKETTIDRTLRLLYVTCSRAEDSLALVLWSSNPTAALERVKNSGWFLGKEVEVIPPP
ncbi:TPA: ATP-dependent helicase [Vibrio parahaemolyticus]|uniref:UvrD-helicase domain-containing protein n=1 Tax=Vibrio parahaemolyticus TaxID=670 RepID=UPI0005F1023A|nr:UvrD-helicase domain-containing protein [Vibrio parahaemolyticus]EKZ9071645.1 ATP-dependent helicase [Vibrio parahaemolyticus]ELJ8820797.1 ATP-dependent helicase [Vibrio parahaemolyticus]ELJ8841409.1 ATP-dependent helicase [Vibrio parahaemolyticus]ELJ8845145.1 ATP-dependent helicase [Vibrio parahaemolyticus]KJR35203.1 Fis family transcriptional regulator [Vibrio parahaemolyticus]